ncbi:MAG TPA: hypothetical protein VFZ72_10285 [Jiangellaceae bacterium]
MASQRLIRRQRLVAPSVRSEQAAYRLLSQMRAAGSEQVLPRVVWLTAAQLPRVIAAENGVR